MKRLTCDIKTMKQITLDTQDYTNNEKAMDEIAKSDYQSDFLGGQNHIALFAEAAKKIDMSNISDYDKDCNEQIQQCLHPYFEGKISLAQGMDDFIKRWSNCIRNYPINLGRKRGNTYEVVESDQY